MDRLSTLLSHFGVNAGTFHSGTFCGLSVHDGEACGHVHLLQAGVDLAAWALWQGGAELELAGI